MNTPSLRNVSLDDKYALDATRAYMTGIEALVRLPILQHQRDQQRGLNTAGFVSGYRGSPLGGLDQALWKAQPFLDKHNIVFQPGVNEDLAATAVWGTQQVNIFPGARFDGVFGLWYGKGPGVDRSMDVIRHANAFGTARHGGVLAVAGDDHAAKSSTLPHQTEHMFIGVSMPILSPANVQEVLDLGIFGWELSRYCGAWVALKAITENMDSAVSAEIDPERVNIVIPEGFELPEDGLNARWPDSALEQEARLNRFKIYAAREFARVNHLNRVVLDSPGARFGIITTGKAYLDVMQALEDLGIDNAKAAKIGLRVYKVGMSWPLEPTATHQFAQGLSEILVVEEKRSIIEDQLTGQLYNWPVNRRPRVVGEFDESGAELLPNLAELTPAMVARAIAARVAQFYQDDGINERLRFYTQKEAVLNAPRQRTERTPHYCSGCPHNTSTRVPQGSRALGGIGCHYMGVFEQGDRHVDTYCQMGGEGVTWVGQAPFTETPHVFQNLGDGTYFHSGLLAIRQTIAARVNITYKILYNDAVAMTGGQPVDGSLTVAQMIWQLKGEGIERIAIVADDTSRHADLPTLPGVTIDHRDNLMNIQEQLRELPGTTILIYDQVCAAEKRRRRKKGALPESTERVMINPDVCEGCGDCGVQSNCLSLLPLETTTGRKRQIDQHACNKDFSCLKGFCPSFVTVSGGHLRAPEAQEPTDLLAHLPEPLMAPINEQPWNIVVTGIGGTGILTVAAIIAMAAHLEGKGCATMNQTGLAQKFGAVVSHVRVGRDQTAIHAVRIAAGDADLLMGCDLVVAGNDDAVAKLNSGRSHAVVNESISSTAEFLANPDAEIPVADIKTLLRNEVGADKVDFLPLGELAEGLLSDTMASNFFLLGYALQKGYLPVSRGALEEAIRLNGVSKDTNLKALNWGRLACIEPEQVRRLAGVTDTDNEAASLQDIIADRRQRLTDYQSAGYAQQYEQVVEQFKQLEQRKQLPLDLTLSVARQLYRVMAYKDEYEVARLLTSNTFAQSLQARFSGDFKLQYHLAPPMISSKDHDGRPRKRRFGSYMRWPMQLLARLKFLRGSYFDLFNLSEDRKLEQKILQEYHADLQLIEATVTAENYEVAVRLAGLVDQVRGFGPVKARNHEAIQNQRSVLKGRLKGQILPAREVVTETA